MRINLFTIPFKVIATIVILHAFVEYNQPYWLWIAGISGVFWIVETILHGFLVGESQ